jgi:hypothetical protein
VTFNGTAKLVHVLPSGRAPDQLYSHHITHRVRKSKGACTWDCESLSLGLPALAPWQQSDRPRSQCGSLTPAVDAVELIRRFFVDVQGWVAIADVPCDYPALACHPTVLGVCSLRTLADAACTVSQSVSVRYKETPRGPANPMQAPGPNPCPALVTQGATNLPQVSPTTCSTQAGLASNTLAAAATRMVVCSDVLAACWHTDLSRGPLTGCTKNGTCCFAFRWHRGALGGCGWRLSFFLVVNHSQISMESDGESLRLVELLTMLHRRHTGPDTTCTQPCVQALVH